MRALKTVVMIWLVLAAATALAQPVPTIEGRTVEGRPFQLSALRGKVVMVVFWSTGCAVCRDKMAELRHNYAGWQGKPFELVAVSVDRRMNDLTDYEKIIASVVPLQQRFVQIWRGEPGYRDSFGVTFGAAPSGAHLPLTYLLDKTGAVVAQYTGRIPAQAWDHIADLL